MKICKILFTYMMLMASAAYAGETDVIEVKVRPAGDDLYSFDVTVRHTDEGWKHYADKWDVVSPDGSVFGTRILHHPHVDEQPFTRSLSGVKIPADIHKVMVRAHDSVHGYGGKEVSLDLTNPDKPEPK